MSPFSQSSALFLLLSFISFPFLHLFPTAPLNYQVKMSLYKAHWNAIVFTSDLFLRLFSSLVLLSLYKLAILVHESFYDKPGTALLRWESHIRRGFPQAPKCKAALEISLIWLIFSYLKWNPKMSKLMGITLKAFSYEDWTRFLSKSWTCLSLEGFLNLWPAELTSQLINIIPVCICNCP